MILHKTEANEVESRTRQRDNRPQATNCIKLGVLSHYVFSCFVCLYTHTRSLGFKVEVMLALVCRFSCLGADTMLS